MYAGLLALQGLEQQLQLLSTTADTRQSAALLLLSASLTHSWCSKPASLQSVPTGLSSRGTPAHSAGVNRPQRSAALEDWKSLCCFTCRHRVHEWHNEAAAA
jgi:hypothetical protein